MQFYHDRVLVARYRRALVDESRDLLQLNIADNRKERKVLKHLEYLDNEEKRVLDAVKKKWIKHQHARLLLDRVVRARKERQALHHDIRRAIIARSTKAREMQRTARDVGITLDQSKTSRVAFNKNKAGANIAAATRLAVKGMNKGVTRAMQSDEMKSLAGKLDDYDSEQEEADVEQADYIDPAVDRILLACLSPDVPTGVPVSKAGSNGNSEQLSVV